MKILKTEAAARAWHSRTDGPLVLVPTMGALHAGHEALIVHARKLAGKDGLVAVSIFVNPTQFGPKEDLSRYPRPWKKDAALCRRLGVDVIFAPDVPAMYRPDASIAIDEHLLSRHLCGASRPGHFRGVCTVVAKLFLILLPDAAVFGEKDWQQLAIIRRLVRDLNIPVKIAAHPTFREDDGLALSSRNAYLTPGERAVAPAIYAALQKARAEKTARAVLATGRRLLRKIPGARLDYLELVDAETLQPVRDLGRRTRLATAVFLGRTRLIDNVGVPVRA